MIIGISGKIGSGKDTLFNVINFLLLKYKFNHLWLYNYEANFNVYMTQTNGNKQYLFQNKKFADKLKDIVCLLIGCTREQLEDQEFKAKELGKEWTINEDYSKYDWLNKNYQMTPRLLLQKIGTDLFRNQLHHDVWINSTFADYVKESFVEGHGGQPDFDWTNSQFEPKPDYPNWILTDVRFPNESEAIKERNGITIRINRDIARITNFSEHESESALDNAKFDVVFENNGTVNDLINQVEKKLFIKMKIHEQFNQ